MKKHYEDQAAVKEQYDIPNEDSPNLLKAGEWSRRRILFGNGVIHDRRLPRPRLPQKDL